MKKWLAVAVLFWAGTNFVGGYCKDASGTICGAILGQFWQETANKIFGFLIVVLAILELI